MHPGRETRHRAAARAARRGGSCNADPNFVGLLLSDWPYRHGRVLPLPLLDTFATGTTTRALLSKTAPQASAVHDLLVLRMRESAPADASGAGAHMPGSIGRSISLPLSTRSLNAPRLYTSA